MEFKCWVIQQVSHILFFVYLKVLDEIHGQPVSLALSMVSLPAPESVVDSFPLKNHEKKTNGGDEIEQ